MGPKQRSGELRRTADVSRTDWPPTVYIATTGTQIRMPVGMLRASQRPYCQTRCYFLHPIACSRYPPSASHRVAPHPRRAVLGHRLRPRDERRRFPAFELEPKLELKLETAAREETPSARPQILLNRPASSSRCILRTRLSRPHYKNAFFLWKSCAMMLAC